MKRHSIFKLASLLSITMISSGLAQTAPSSPPAGFTIQLSPQVPQDEDKPTAKASAQAKKQAGQKQATASRNGIPSGETIAPKTRTSSRQKLGPGASNQTRSARKKRAKKRRTLRKTWTRKKTVKAGINPQRRKNDPPTEASQRPTEKRVKRIISKRQAKKRARKKRKVRRKTKPSSKKRRTGRAIAKTRIKRPKKMLRGTQGPFARKSPWGIIDTVPAYIAAGVRDMFSGRDEQYGRPLIFGKYLIDLHPDDQETLRALAAYLRLKKDIRLIMLEGHADDSSEPSANHALSEARASAVREFLINRDVGPNRTIAYGVGNAHPPPRRRGANRRVIVRLVTGEPRQGQPSNDWNQIAAVNLNGIALWSSHNTNVKTDGKAKQSNVSWQPIKAGAQLGTPSKIKTTVGTQLTVRGVDNTQFLIFEDSEVEYDRLQQTNAETYETTIRMPKGHVRVGVHPGETASPKVTAYSPFVTLITGSADFEMNASSKNGWLSVRRGTVRAKTRTGLELTVGSGQNVFITNTEQSVWAQLTAPTLVAPPPNGQVAEQGTLSWKSSPHAMMYRVEVSRDMNMNDMVNVSHVGDQRLALNDLQPGQQYYWRVLPIDKYGMPGHGSQIRRFTVKPLKRTRD